MKTSTLGKISVVSILTFACQESPSNSSASVATDSSRQNQSFASKAEFPTCDQSFEGVVVFSKEDRSFFVCSSGEYITAVLQNETSASSPTGTDAPGTSGTAETGDAPAGTNQSSPSGSSLTSNCSGTVDSIPAPVGVTGQFVISLPPDVKDVDPCSIEG
jgi:hypothetical protein